MSGSQSGRKVLVSELIEEAAGVVADLFEKIVCDAVETNGTCNISLAGGTTPRRFYQHLAGMAASSHVPWGKLEVFFGDERDVPHDHVDSNYCMVQRALLDHVPIEPARVHPMPADTEDLETAASEYEQIIRGIVPGGDDGIPRFDLILLGMGGDGHVASLFPQGEALKETQKLVSAEFIPVLGRNRMTFTFPLINAAHNVILFVTGSDKADAVASAFSGDRDLPGTGIAPCDGALHVVLDATAASKTQFKPGEES